MLFFELRGVARFLRLREFKLRLERPRVDLREHAAGRDVLAFAEHHFFELSVDARFDRHREERRHGADPREVGRNILFLDGRRHRRHRRRAPLGGIRRFGHVKRGAHHHRRDQHHDARRDPEDLLAPGVNEFPHDYSAAPDYRSKLHILRVSCTIVLHRVHRAGRVSAGRNPSCIPSRIAAYSVRSPAARITLPHFAISDLMKSPNCSGAAGERCAPGIPARQRRPRA